LAGGRVHPTSRAAAVVLLASAFLLAGEAFSIVVAPTSVYMEAGSPSANLTLFNPSSVPEEVTIEAVFGYPTTDADGTLGLFLEEGSGDPRSAAGWIRAYPSRVVVPPGGRQVVRLLAEPPTGLEDGEYWTRLVVTSRGQRIPTEGAGDSPDVHVGLSLEVRTVIPATFRKGELSTGVTVDDLEPRVEDGTLILRPRIERQGSAAFIGHLNVALIDTSGEVVREWMEQLAVYRDYHRLLRYPVSDLAPGDYDLRLTITNADRDDVPRSYRLPASVVEREVEMRIP